MDRVAWTDERLSDQFRALWDRMNLLEKTNERLAVIETSLPEMRDEVSRGISDCRSAIGALSDAFAERTRAREIERKDREQQRRSDRKWLIGTMLAAATIVVGAMGVLIPLLSSGP